MLGRPCLSAIINQSIANPSLACGHRAPDTGTSTPPLHGWNALYTRRARAQRARIYFSREAFGRDPMKCREAPHHHTPSPTLSRVGCAKSSTYRRDGRKPTPHPGRRVLLSETKKVRFAHPPSVGTISCEEIRHRLSGSLGAENLSRLPRGRQPASARRAPLASTLRLTYARAH